MVWLFSFLHILRIMILDCDGFVQDSGNSTLNTLELLQSCAEPSVCQLLGLIGYSWLVGP